ncbi:MAG: hypothetical protein DSZ28_04565 [Thiothrix sp.]|nr:MAG: hypothetical protein DSZ28_04565 [Thiothrix sp.]
MVDAHSNSNSLAIKADMLIKKHAFGSGVFGYVPFPILDALGILAVQRRMLSRLARLYRVPYSQSLAKDLLRTLAGGIATRATIPVAMKIIPGIGVLFGSTGMAAIGSASTYAVGKIFQRHFEEGGTLEDFNAEQSKEDFETELKAGLKLSQVKKKKPRH